MKIYFDNAKNLVIVEGIKEPFLPWSLTASDEGGKVSVWNSSQRIRIIGPMSFHRFKDKDSNGFVSLEDTITYLNTVFSTERPRKQFKWETSVATDTWTINHNFGFYPRAVIHDSAGTEFTPDLIHLDVYTLQINFAYPMSGTAVLL